MNWRGRGFEFQFPRRMLIMGIVNVTPDSFSDGGQFLDPKRAIAHGHELIRQGADILDIGGESTRPGAAPVPEEEELYRVMPVIEALAGSGKPISIDTQKPAVARRALEAGAMIVNDIAANRPDRLMWDIVAESGAGYVLMHMKGTPQTMQKNPVYADVTREVGDFFAERLEQVVRYGIKREQVVLDPGIGFGKKMEHNLQLLAELKRFTVHKQPVLLGVSRKSFISKVLGGEPCDPLPGSLACAAWAVLNGVQIIRVHDVAATVQCVRMIEEMELRQH